MCNVDMTAATIDELCNKFSVSGQFGFLLENPLKELPIHYRPWQEIGDNLPNLIESGRVRSEIQKMPVISAEELVTHNELRLAHLQLTTLLAGYVWSQGDEHVPKSVPPQISVPLFSVSGRLDVPPCCIHASCCLANYQLREKSVAASAENMDMISFKVSEDYGNDWFFLNTAQIELDFAPSIRPIIIAALGNVEEGSETVRDALSVIDDCLCKMRETLARMKDKLKPDVFYNEIRPYLRGFTNGKFKEWGGIVFEGVPNGGPRKLNGGSAAQSSTLQLLDAFLGIEQPKEALDFLETQLDFMPIPHRRLIRLVRHKSRAKQLSNESEELKEAYDGCVRRLTAFRSDHLRVVTSFIVIPSSNVKENSSAEQASTGTGGTGFLHFLKSVRNNTRNYTEGN